MNSVNYLEEVAERANPDLLHQTLAVYFDEGILAQSADRNALAAIAKDTLAEHSLQHWAKQVHTLAHVCEPDIFAKLLCKVDPERRAEYRTIGNEYDRLIWLYHHMPEVFDEACELLRNTVIQDPWATRPCRLFVVEQAVGFLHSQEAQSRFIRAIAKGIGCREDDIAWTHHGTSNVKGLHPSQSVIEVTLAINRPAALAHHVIDGVQRAYDIVDVDTYYLAYYPESHTLAVYTHYEAFAVCFAKVFVWAFISPLGKVIAQQHNLQRLLHPTLLRSTHPDMQWAKVNALESVDNASKHALSVPKDDPRDIYGTLLANARFKKPRGLLVRARIVFAMRDDDRGVRHGQIELRGKYTAYFQTQSGNDRRRCHQWLCDWGLTARRPGNAASFG